MPLTRTNRRGQLYYLHSGQTKTGRPHWYMSTKSAGHLADALPDGYEFWESPEDAQVHVRKVPPRIFTDAELELVRKLARTKAKTPYTIVDVKGKAIIAYAADDDSAEWSRMLGGFGNANPAAVRQVMQRNLHYLPMLRFELVDPKSRTFFAYRWCFLGSIDDWFPLDTGPLPKLAAKYIPHLGNESFYELM